MKRTGGATASTLIGWNLAAEHVKAQGGIEKPKEGESNGDATVAVSSHMYRTKRQKQRKARSIVGSQEIWVDVGPPSTPSLSVGPNGTDGKSPDKLTPPPAPTGFPVDKGWVETANDLLTAIKEKLPGAGNPTETTEDESNFGSNDGQGLPPAGYTWLSSTKTLVTKEKVPYSRNRKFSKK